MSRIVRVTAVRVIAALSIGVGTLTAQEPPRLPRPTRAPAAPAPRPTPRPTPAPSPSVWSLDGAFLDPMWRDEVAREVSRAARIGADAARAGIDAARMAMTIDGAALRADMAALVPLAELSALASLSEMHALAAVDGVVNLSGLSTLRSRGYRTEAPEPWAQADPADSIYREARKALSSDAYRKAADLFNQIWRRYPTSTYTPDAYYWQAFALQRLGGDQNIGEALATLETQAQKFPKAATRGDAAALRARMEGVLARRGDQAMATTLLGRAESATRDGCPRANDDERIDALNAVTQMDADKAMPILKKVLARREACTQQLRRTAVWLVASRKQPDAAEILMHVAKTDPDKEVREQAVFWMANVPTDEATGMLIDLARRGDDLDLRKRAVYALSRSKQPRAATTLREIALDENAPDELRSDALQWYASGPGKASDDGFAFLKDMYGKSDRPRLKERVLQQIASRRTDESREFLVLIATNPRESMDVRRMAVSVIGNNSMWANARVSGMLTGVGATSAAGSATAALATTAAQLTTIYDKSPDVDIRRQVLSSLASLRENAGIDKLIDVARNEKNLELRKSAVSMLTRTKDPRALALLQEIIDR
ncbi:HEAT repeat domain-containing protein [Gemmatimonas sp.]|uniref:HEAT repeat domain-containing protein n=1 Tax=Gemmatimonas sp. TaxID=1962908 RepID=UPI003982E521